MRHSEESVEEVLRYARKRGHRPTRAQRRRFQQNGLIPKPRQVGLGRGVGTEVFYPEGTGPQLVAACKAIKRGSFKIARWELWWSGFTIEEKWLRADLLAHLKAIERNEGVPRQFTRRSNREQLKQFHKFNAQIRLGAIAESLDSNFEKIVARILGIDFLVREFRKPNALPISGLGNLLLSWFKALSPENLEAAVKSATVEELRITREEFRAFIAEGDSLGRLLAGLGQPVLGRRLATWLIGLSPTLQRSGVTFWLAGRKYPFARKVYEVMLALCRQSSSTFEPEK